MSEAKKPKKEKRQLPLRPPGAPVNTQNVRPSALLFSEVKRLQDLEDDPGGPIAEAIAEPVIPVEEPELIPPPALPVEPPVEVETTGQLVNQFKANQSTSAANQSTSGLVNQSTSPLVNQLASDKNYPSRRLRKLKGLRLPIQKLEKWEFWCFLNKVDFQDAVEQAMDWLTSQPVNHVLIDDLEDIGTTDDVLIFYHRWTGNRITEKDKDAREKIRNFSDDVCKIGIAISIYRAKTKINSFKYCVGAIEEAADTPHEDPGSYLNYLIKKLTEKRTKS